MCMWGWQRGIEPALCPALVPPGVSSPAAYCLRSLWAGGDKEETSQRVPGFSEEVRKLLAPISPLFFLKSCFPFRMTSRSMLKKKLPKSTKHLFLKSVEQYILAHVRAHPHFWFKSARSATQSAESKNCSSKIQDSWHKTDQWLPIFIQESL